MNCPHCGKEVTPKSYSQGTANLVFNVPGADGCAQVMTQRIVAANPYPQVQITRDNTLCSAAYSPQASFVRF